LGTDGATEFEIARADRRAISNLFRRHEMDSVTKHKLIWGWLRLMLAFLQISFVGASVGALLAVGLRPVTFLFLGLATTAAAISLLIYRGRSDPKLRDIRTSRWRRE